MLERLYAWWVGARYFNFEKQYQTRAKTEIQTFLAHSTAKEPRLKELREQRTRAGSDAAAIEAVYDAVYADDAAGECLYAYHNALLDESLFTEIVGATPSACVQKKILDLGAGSGELEAMLVVHGATPQHITTVDTSRASAARLSRRAHTAYAGTLADAGIEDNAFDLLFHSYFLDYDTDQKDTFSEMLRVARPGSILVLEGLFPVHFKVAGVGDSVTRGLLAIDDIERVRRFLVEEGASQGKTVRLEQLSRGKRYVLASMGLRHYPSYFLTFSIA